MPYLDTNDLKVIDRLPGWKGRLFHTASMTFAHYDFTAGSTIHEHFHPRRRCTRSSRANLSWRSTESKHVVRPGIVAIVPSNVRHSVRALTSGRVIIVDHPTRPEFG
jgi:unsaturated pyranuronate lyase